MWIQFKYDAKSCWLESKPVRAQAKVREYEYGNGLRTLCISSLTWYEHLYFLKAFRLIGNPKTTQNRCVGKKDSTLWSTRHALPWVLCRARNASRVNSDNCFISYHWQHCVFKDGGYTCGYPVSVVPRFLTDATLTASSEIKLLNMGQSGVYFCCVEWKKR